MSAALADADLSDLDEALRHLSLVPTAERGPAWYAYSDALLEARANLDRAWAKRTMETRIMHSEETRNA